MAEPRGCRDRRPRAGRSVQPPPPARANRRHPASPRPNSAAMPNRRPAPRRRRTQRNMPPESPARYKTPGDHQAEGSVARRGFGRPEATCRTGLTQVGPRLAQAFGKALGGSGGDASAIRFQDAGTETRAAVSPAGPVIDWLPPDGDGRFAGRSIMLKRRGDSSSICTPFIRGGKMRLVATAGRVRGRCGHRAAEGPANA